jgi:PPOX class probable FMN-dependent enzyme
MDFDGATDTGKHQTRESAMAQRFGETIVTRERLRQIYRQPSHRVANKAIDRIDHICRAFIAACPFVVVATRGADGKLDLSPKGDPPGFIAVLNDKTLAIPERLGNNRLDTFENVLVHPEVGLFLLIPGNGDTLRISGKGQIVQDPELQEQASINNKAPSALLVVTVEEAFMHCAKAVKRSRIWVPEFWPDRSAVPTLAEAMVVHGELEETVPEMQAIIEKDSAERLY